MGKARRVRMGEFVKNIGVRSVVTLALVFLLTVAATVAGGY